MGTEQAAPSSKPSSEPATEPMAESTNLTTELTEPTKPGNPMTKTVNPVTNSAKPVAETNPVVEPTDSASEPTEPTKPDNLMTKTVNPITNSAKPVAETNPVVEPTNSAIRPTEAQTEAPTQTPIEPQTEALTDPKLEGTPVEFNEVLNRETFIFREIYTEEPGLPHNESPFDDMNYEKVEITYSIGSHSIMVLSRVYQDCAKFQEILTDDFDITYHNSDMISRYTDEYFKNNALIAVFILRYSRPFDHKINAVTKRGSELCINIGADDETGGKGTWDALSTYILLIEIDKEVLQDVDTISHYVTVL